MDDEDNIFITVDQLRVGIYVHLDLGWADHPFTFNSFKIKNKQQVQTIRRLGKKTIRWEPDRSDVEPLSSKDSSEVEEISDQDELALDEQICTELANKQLRVQQLADYRKKIEAVEESFLKASQSTQQIIKKIIAKPEESVAQASAQVKEIIDCMSGAPELALQVISGKNGNASIYSHALNVSVMSIIFAYELDYPSEKAFVTGLGAMLHDIGLIRVPDRVTKSRGQLSKYEIAARQMHCQYGVDIAKQANLGQDLQDIIYQHHEYFDGSGYPQGLQGDEIDEIAQLVGLVNHYDNMCNPQNVSSVLTPHEALSTMYARQSHLFEPRLLQGFIRFMGVYPPGCVVNLSNDTVGIVIKVYSSTPLRPTIIVYDEDIPKHEAVILDLREESDINVSKAINPSRLPPEIFTYLSPQERINYYFDTV